jgi:hypothetical protein
LSRPHSEKPVASGENSGKMKANMLSGKPIFPQMVNKMVNKKLDFLAFF